MEKLDESAGMTADAAQQPEGAEYPVAADDSTVRACAPVQETVEGPVQGPDMNRTGCSAATITSRTDPVPPHASDAVRRQPTTAGKVPRAHGVMPSGCACGGSAGEATQLVFAIGRLDYDLGTESRRDSLASHMRQSGMKENPDDAEQLLAYLEKNPWEAQSVEWTLTINDTPIYAIEPAGAFAAHVYDLLLQFIREQIRDGAERISVPGVISGTASLLRLAGATVPMIRPNPRGMYNWTTGALIESVSGKAPAKDAPEEKRADYQRRIGAVRAVLDRVYYDRQFINLGLEGRDRALNYAMTNALNVDRAIEAALKNEMELDSIQVEPSGICRPDSECYDVQLFFYDPRKQIERARQVFQFAVDVSDEVPVMIGPMRSWSVR